VVELAVPKDEANEKGVERDREKPPELRAIHGAAYEKVFSEVNLRARAKILVRRSSLFGYAACRLNG
jgi:hypothetical protein